MPAKSRIQLKEKEIKKKKKKAKTEIKKLIYIIYDICLCLFMHIIKGVYSKVWKAFLPGWLPNCLGNCLGHIGVHQLASPKLFDYLVFYHNGTSQ